MIGTHLLIPAGTSLRGRYNSEVSPGQSRLLFALTLMRFRSGAFVRLAGGMPGSDAGGASGAEGEVNRHFWQQFGTSIAVGAAAMLANRGNGNNANVTINLGGSGNSGSAGSTVATQALSDVVKRMLERNQNIKDTLTLKKGEELTLVTNRAMDLPPSVTRVPQN
jgi:type IV secretion system protein VirB10